MPQNFISTIWLNQTYKQSGINVNSTTHLCFRNIDPNLITFRDSFKCLNYISNLGEFGNNVILLVTYDTFYQPSDMLLQLCEQLNQIGSIYILCSTEIHNRQLAEKLTKYRGIYKNVESLCHKLLQLPYFQNKRQKAFIQNPFTINTLPPTYIPSFTISNSLSSPIKSTDNTKYQEAEFMYSTFLREILIEFESTEEEMISFCRDKFADDKTQLNYIEEFEDYYESSNAIFWYTRDTFLYRMLNQSLRDVDIDTLYKLRYFIKDLHLQLTEQHKLQQISVSVDQPSSIQTVYRGQLMDNNEFDKKIRYNIGGFFSVSSFLSTTPFKNLASVYAGGGSSVQQSDAQHVLFHIDIDNSIKKFFYADVTAQSVFAKVECETLFTMGAIYRILSVTLDSENTWNVKLKLTGDEDEELKALTEHMKYDIITPYPLLNLAKLMVKMGYYENAEKYHLLLLEDRLAIDDMRIWAGIHNNLGLIYSHLNQEAKAIENSEKGIAILIEHSSETDLEQLQAAYNNFGEHYRIRGDFQTALLYYNKALNVAIENTDANQIQTATVYNNIAIIYATQYRQHEALEMLERTLSILTKVLPSTHPQLASTYNNIVHIMIQLRDYTRAAELLNTILEIQKNSLLHDHPIFGITFNQFGMVCHIQGKFKEALDWYNKALQVVIKHVPVNHPHFAIYYNNISTAYAAQDQHALAIEYASKALEIQINSLSPNHSDMVATYFNLYLGYNAEGKQEKALKMYEKSSEIFTQILANNPDELAKHHYTSSAIYYQYGLYDKQIEYLNKALEIYLNLQPTNYKELASVYNSFGVVFFQQGKHQESLIMLQKSLDIRIEYLSVNDIDIAQSYDHIAKVHAELGDNDETVECLKKMLSVHLIALSSNSKDLGKAYEKLGNAYYKQGKLNEALITMEKSLEIYISCLPHSHPDIASAYGSIAGVYYDQSNYNKQIEYLNKALEIYLQSQPLSYTDIATVYNDYGLGLVHQGKYQESLYMLEKSLEFRIQHLSTNHRDIATSYNNIAQVFSQLNNHCEAADYYKKALSVQLISFPSNSEELAKTYSRLGTTYYRQGKLNEALTSFEKSLEVIIFNQTCSRSFFTILSSNLSEVRILLTDCDKQIEYLKETLKAQMNFLPSNHPDLACIYYNLAEAFFRQKNLKETLENMRKKHEIDSKSLLPDDDEMRLNVNTIAILEILLWQWSK
ncbi:unnamed protein product [Adineta steineri]|uniref:Uncharacterized protein n=1 Tax=Adineta steineri TaxID=433720 RepID=A0A815BU66_9BILA|nr:unnamed protein product [Adineta steineri]CAF1561493.1 unnamed protein product [Adineta steineri]